MNPLTAPSNRGREARPPCPGRRPIRVPRPLASIEVVTPTTGKLAHCLRTELALTLSWVFKVMDEVGRVGSVIRSVSISAAVRPSS